LPLELLRELVALPSVCGDEGAKLDLLERHLADFAPRRLPVPGLPGNLLCTAPGSGPRVVLCAHVDTVQPAPGWDVPWEPREADGRLTGLGAADMQAGLAIAVTLFRELAGRGPALTLLLTCDEEGWCQGVHAALPVLEGDIALVLEPSNEAPVLAMPGRAVYRLTLEADGGHATRPGSSALSAAAVLVPQIEALPAGGSIAVLDFESHALGLSHPQRAELTVDRHLAPGESREAVAAQLAALAPGLAVVESERPMPAPEPYATPRTPEVARLLALCDRPPTRGTSVGDYNFLATVMPTVVLGPRGGNWHAPGEWVELASVARVAAIYRRFLLGGAEP